MVYKINRIKKFVKKIIFNCHLKFIIIGCIQLYIKIKFDFLQIVKYVNIFPISKIKF